MAYDIQGAWGRRWEMQPSRVGLSDLPKGDVICEPVMSSVIYIVHHHCSLMSSRSGLDMQGCPAAKWVQYSQCPGQPAGDAALQGRTLWLAWTRHMYNAALTLFVMALISWNTALPLLHPSREWSLLLGHRRFQILRRCLTFAVQQQQHVDWQCKEQLCML